MIKLFFFTRPILLVFLSLFFERKFLKGRYFDSSFIGYKWAFKTIWTRNILRLAPTSPFPIELNVKVGRFNNIHFDPDDINNFQSPGTYFQNYNAEIYIGKGVYIAPNVGIITSNHDLSELDKHDVGKDVVIGDNSWIGMNSIILPGVHLAPSTIVAAGSIVTKSIGDPGCVIAGNPAKLIKKINE